MSDIKDKMQMLDKEDEEEIKALKKQWKACRDKKKRLFDLQKKTAAEENARRDRAQVE